MTEVIKLSSRKRHLPEPVTCDVCFEDERPFTLFHVYLAGDEIILQCAECLSELMDEE